MTRPIYLDNNASTPVDPRVFRAMRPYLETHFGNPSCAHPYGQNAASAVSDARAKVAMLLGCASEEIIFTSGGTESNNIAIFGTASARKDTNGIVTSSIEHPAINGPCGRLAESGNTTVKIGVDSHGIVDPTEFNLAMNKRTTLATLMHANNETGSMQPVWEIADAARKLGVTSHTDAAQTVGKVRTRVDELGVDLLTIAGHKLYAPKGVGALFVRKGTPLHPVLLGAGHENGLRPGTENVAGIVALGAACELAEERLGAGSDPVETMRDEFHEMLLSAIADLTLNGHPKKRLPNTLNVSFPRVRGSALLERAEKIAASTGSACHEGSEETPSSVLTEMGIPLDVALGAVRLSLGHHTSPEDIRLAAKSLVDGYNSLVS